MMIDARAHGFEVVLVYIGTENVELNLARIRDRVLAGGHNVPEPDVRRRYKRKFCEPSNGHPRRRSHHPVRQFNRRGLPARRSSWRVRRPVVQTHPGLGRHARIAGCPSIRAKSLSRRGCFGISERRQTAARRDHPCFARVGLRRPASWALCPWQSGATASARFGCRKTCPRS